MRTEFVDRVEDLGVLRTAVRGLREGRGGAVVLEGRSGIGKSELLRHFAREAAEPGEGSVRVVSTSCRAHTGEGFPFGPIVNILSELSEPRSDRRSFQKLAKRASRGAAQAAPDLLATLVPALGPFMPAIRSAAEAAMRTGQIPGDSLQALQQAIALRVAEQMRTVARAHGRLVVIIDDVQFIDDSSLQVLDLLVQRLEGEPLVVVLSRTTGNPAASVRRDVVSELVTQWARLDLVQRHQVRRLPSNAVAELVGLRYEAAPPEFAAHLDEVTDGLPLFVQLCLDQWRPQDGARFALPETVAEVVRDQLGVLDEQDRRLLSYAAVQGTSFLTAVLARSAAVPHDEVLERLRLLAIHRTLIKPVARPDWAAAEATDAYGFDHLLLWDAVYQAQTEEQRRSGHERVALVLESIAHEYEQPPLGLRLELARHLELGAAPCAEACAKVRLDLARSAARGGLSFAEAELHCGLAIAAAQTMRSGRERDRLLVEAIEMLLSMTEVRWRGRRAEDDDSRDIDGLAARAAEAAVREGSPRLIAATTLLRGKTLLATEGVERALPKLAAAVELADGLDDPLRAFVARVEYGRQLGKRNLAAALEVLREAEAMYLSDPRLSGSDDFVLQHAHNLLEMQLAVNIFDDGHSEEALGRLLRCTDRLRAESVNLELPIAFNYLAQVQLALGRSADAERTLREALRLEEKRGGDSGWHAYNAALLALSLSAHRGGAGESVELIEQAWAETERTWLINLVPIVRNLLAEVLLRTARATAVGAEAEAEILSRADELARGTCIETLKSGMVRSRIAALSLRARIQLHAGRTTKAAHFARESVQLLDEVGTMPALRSEEVFYHAARALAADGDRDEALVLLERARDTVARKAAHIADPGLREGFLRDVPLNRRIEEDSAC